MSWLNKLESRLAPYALPQLALYLVIGQTFVLLTGLLGLVDPGRLVLVPSLVLEGEIWRLVTFIFMPASWNWLFAAFSLYLLYLFGTALEAQWGVLRFNLFIALGYLLTVAVAFVFPNALATNIFINGSLFLAFAHLNPSFTMLMFFILPVQIRWLAALTWVLTAFLFITGNGATRLMILAASGNFLIFFGRSMFNDLRTGNRRIKYHAKAAAARRDAVSRPRHTCVICGKNNLTHPDLDFRYCSKCAGDQCYCPDHLRDHEHISEAELHTSA